MAPSLSASFKGNIVAIVFILLSLFKHTSILFLISLTCNISYTQNKVNGIGMKSKCLLILLHVFPESVLKRKAGKRFFFFPVSYLHNDVLQGAEWKVQ